MNIVSERLCSFTIWFIATSSINGQFNVLKSVINIEASLIFCFEKAIGMHIGHSFKMTYRS